MAVQHSNRFSTYVALVFRIARLVLNSNNPDLGRYETYDTINNELERNVMFLNGIKRMMGQVDNARAAGKICNEHVSLLTTDENEQKILKCYWLNKEGLNKE